MSGQVTIHDVAKRANVSASTVSYVLNDGPKPVSQATRDKVLAITRELNFSPNAAARALACNRSRTVGVAFYCMEYLADSSLSTILSGVNLVLGVKDYNLQFAVTTRTTHAHRNQYFISKVEERRLDGVIVFDQRVPDEELLRLRAMGAPMVVIDKDVPGLDSPIIFINHKKAVEMSVRHFMEHGYRRIGFHSGTDYLYTDALRIGALKDTLGKLKMPCDERLIFQSQARETFPRAVEVLRSLGKEPIALIVGADTEAVEIMRAGAAVGMEPGKDLAIVAYDDRPIATAAQPRLTVISPPYQKIGALAATHLISMIEGKQQKARRVVVEPELIIRESCGAHSRNSRK